MFKNEVENVLRTVQGASSVVHLQFAGREVEDGAIPTPQENGVLDRALAESEIQERLSQATAQQAIDPKATERQSVCHSQRSNQKNGK